MEQSKLMDGALYLIGQNRTEETWQLLFEVSLLTLKAKGWIPTGFRLFCYTSVRGHIILRQDATGMLWATTRTN